MVEIALVAVLFVGVGGWAVWNDRVDEGGLFFWERRRLRASGARASGRVLRQERLLRGDE